MFIAKHLRELQATWLSYEASEQHADRRVV